MSLQEKARDQFLIDNDIYYDTPNYDLFLEAFDSGYSVGKLDGVNVGYQKVTEDVKNVLTKYVTAMASVLNLCSAADMNPDATNRFIMYSGEVREVIERALNEVQNESIV